MGRLVGQFVMLLIGPLVRQIVGPLVGPFVLQLVWPLVRVVVWWCGGGFFTDYNTTPTKVVLSCFGLLVGLWQFLVIMNNSIPKT